MRREPAELPRAAQRVARPGVSTVMPVYDGAATLRETLDSVVAQSFGDRELLAVDDGSDDESAAIVESPDEPGRDHRQPVPRGDLGTQDPIVLVRDYLATGYRTTPCTSASLVSRDLLLESEPMQEVARGNLYEHQCLWLLAAARGPVRRIERQDVLYRRDQGSFSESKPATFRDLPAIQERAALAIVRRTLEGLGATETSAAIVGLLETHLRRTIPRRLIAQASRGVVRRAMPGAHVAMPAGRKPPPAPIGRSRRLGFRRQRQRPLALRWTPRRPLVLRRCGWLSLVATLTAIPLYDIECFVLATLAVGAGLTLALRKLRRTRPELAVGHAVATGVALRLIATAGVAVTGLAPTLRGYDEARFVRDAHRIALSGFDSGVWLPSGTYRLHEIVFALQITLFDFPDSALRVTQIGIAMLGIVLVVASIHDLAGPRAAHIAAWVLALEPAEIFFNSILHREPLLVLASGLVVFGGTKVWNRLDVRGVAIMGLGCAIATATRPYAGWFLITGALLLVLHASVRQLGSRVRSVPLIFGVVAVIIVATPAVLRLTSESSLQQNLQGAQDANTNASTARGDANSNNLSLERVDFSTRSDLLQNLPRRVRDVVLRPYPWQLQDTSQRLGAIGTTVVLVALYLLIRYARRTRGRILAISAPILYPAFALLVAYALSVGNAGTGFRYRTHLVLLGLAVLIVLREHALRDGAGIAVDREQKAQNTGARPVVIAGGTAG